MSPNEIHRHRKNNKQKKQKQINRSKHNPMQDKAIQDAKLSSDFKAYNRQIEIKERAIIRKHIFTCLTTNDKPVDAQYVLDFAIGYQAVTGTKAPSKEQIEAELSFLYYIDLLDINEHGHYSIS